MNKQKPKIFLSYAHEDIGMAKRIYNDLTNAGFNVWFDRESLLPGQVWDLEIENAIESCEYFFCLLSSKSVDQVGYIHKEIRTALDKLDLYPEGKIFIIPIRLDECQPSHRMINKIQWVDLFPEVEYQKGLEKIKEVISLNIPHNFKKEFLNSRLGEKYHRDQNSELEKRSIYFKNNEMFQFRLEVNNLSKQFKYALKSGIIFSFIFDLTQKIISKYFHILFGRNLEIRKIIFTTLAIIFIFGIIYSLSSCLITSSGEIIKFREGIFASFAIFFGMNMFEPIGFLGKALVIFEKIFSIFILIIFLSSFILTMMKKINEK